MSATSVRPARKGRAQVSESQESEPEAVAAARGAGLRYVYDSMPGIYRKRAGKGFSYVDASGARVSDPEFLARARALAIPPAWTDVWVCGSDRGHIQATGRDAKGRKQYRYHAKWRAVRDETKYDRMLMFGEALPAIRRRVDRDLAQEGLPRAKVVAAVISLIDRTFIRVGNDEYARHNGSFGLTTLRTRHVEVTGSTIRFQFRGKAGRMHEIDIEHPRCARVIRRCRDLPGYRLFGYVDESGKPSTIESGDVNDYLRETTGEEITAKDFRTWAGTVLFARALREVGGASSQRETARKINDAVEAVAAILGNTKAVCRSCYVHPALIKAFEGGTFEEIWDSCCGGRKTGLRADEATVLKMMRRLTRARRKNGKKKAA